MQSEITRPCRSRAAVRPLTSPGASAAPRAMSETCSGGALKTALALSMTRLAKGLSLGFFARSWIEAMSSLLKRRRGWSAANEDAASTNRSEVMRFFILMITARSDARGNFHREKVESLRKLFLRMLGKGSRKWERRRNNESRESSRNRLPAGGQLFLKVQSRSALVGVPTSGTPNGVKLPAGIFFNLRTQSRSGPAGSRRSILHAAEGFGGFQAHAHDGGDDAAEEAGGDGNQDGPGDGGGRRAKDGEEIGLGVEAEKIDCDVGSARANHGADQADGHRLADEKHCDVAVGEADRF